jgi:hypothetical protein
MSRKALPYVRLLSLIGDDGRWREAPREAFSDDRAWRRWNAQNAGRKVGDTSAVKVRLVERDGKWRVEQTLGRLRFSWFIFITPDDEAEGPPSPLLTQEQADRVSNYIVALDKLIERAKAARAAEKQQPEQAALATEEPPEPPPDPLA